MDMTHVVLRAPKRVSLHVSDEPHDTDDNCRQDGEAEDSPKNPDEQEIAHEEGEESANPFVSLIEVGVVERHVFS